MPTSSPEGKEQMLAWLNGPVRDAAERGRPAGMCVLDVGPGEGAYARMARRHVRTERDVWIGLEVWGPYLEQYQLSELYHELVVADARFVDFELLPGLEHGTHRWDAVVLGDVVEHMAAAEAADLLARLHGFTPFVLASLPIVHWPQGAVHGNPYEAHVEHWAPEGFEALARRAGWSVPERQLGAQVGVFLLTEPPVVVGQEACA